MTEMMGDVMLTLDQYADAVGASTRTVMRWLKANEVPGASKDEGGAWQIPASARRVTGGGAPYPVTHPAWGGVHDAPVVSQEVAFAPQGRGLTVVDDTPDILEEVEPPLLEELDDLPAFLTVAQASRFLGIPQAQIVGNAERFHAEPIGTQGSLRIPQRVVRRIAGM